jgi:PhnB protein
MAVKPIPDGYSGATPYLIIKGAAQALEFYEQALGATEVLRMADPTGKIHHAEIKIGTANIMLADEFPDRDILGPRSLGGSPVTLHLYVEDVDVVVAKAVAAGATLLRPVEDQFYGDRIGFFEDPFGHRWSFATHIEDVDPDELQRRAEAQMADAGDE